MEQGKTSLKTPGPRRESEDASPSTLPFPSAADPNPAETVDAAPLASEPATGDSSPSEACLIDAALQGDRNAFGQLVERHQDRLYNALVRFTGSPEDARDLTQEALVQALLKLDRFRRDSAFFTWLYRIAFNRAVSASRKRRERQSIDGLPPGVRDPPDPAGQPESHAQATEHAELVHRAIGALADDFRTVLVLREFEGLDYQQIADIVQTPVGTVRSRLFRARSQLRDELCAQGYVPDTPAESSD
ncbi:MAG: sigma-70 family RNA polymerase sigma factor [Planctomycetota bacterium]